MLLFRSEEHIERWRAKWHQPTGGNLSLRQAWDLAKAWFTDDRRLASWRRKTNEETQAVFQELGLTSDFWRL